VGADSAVRVGWLSPAGAYLRLSQSSAQPAELVSFEVGALREATGTVRVGETAWTVHPGPRDELVWVADLGAARMLITGSAGDAEFRTLATAALAAVPVPG
jgi:hypothetical protein